MPERCLSVWSTHCYSTETVVRRIASYLHEATRRKLTRDSASQLGEEALRVEGRTTSGSGRGDGLLVMGVDQVTAGENSRQVGAGGWLGAHDVSGIVQVDLAPEQLGARVVSDGFEDS